uniref:hypothetical protein n=1 Tax=Flavobacterium sp. TaxID=239 RepID=UPI0037C09180
MTSKLFDIDRSVSVSLVTQESRVSLENDFDQLDRQVFGFVSVGRVYDAVAQESLVFVDIKNVVLYNEYVNVLAMRMGVEAPKRVALESLNNDGVVVTNSQLAIEGWMGDIWQKIKDVFKNIYTKVKSFFTTYFTRLGKLKKSLDNLQSVLGSTTKEMGDPTSENPPEGLLKAFSGNTEVNSNHIHDSIASVSLLVSTISKVSQSAEGYAKKGIVDGDFIKNIKELKERALKASQDSAANRQQRKETKLIGDSQKKKDLDNENKSLQEIAQTNEKIGDEMGQELDKEGEADTGDQEENKKKVQAEFDQFLQTVIASFEKVKGKHLVNGQMVKSVSSDAEEGLKLEMADDVTPATSLIMGGKSALLGLVSECQKLIKVAETDIKKYGQVNDAIMESFKTIDSLMNDIDKVDPERFGKYKKVINEIVRHRLQLLRQFFTTYNRSCKNVFEMSMDVCEQTVNYSVLSLKHF